LQWRGTGLSGGSLDSTGAADQRDLAGFLDWACKQPWSNGDIGLYGFSASAIVVYNAMHLHLACVRTAVLMAGTVDLYRDLLDIGGVPNLLPGAVVEATIGGPALLNGPNRLAHEPATIPATTLGYATTPLQVAVHRSEDSFWRERTFTGDRDRIPILADTSFFDVELRGPFLAYRATRQFGSHLLVCGAHDGFPAGTPGPFVQYQNWFNHSLLGAPLSAANDVPVNVCLANGSREQFLANNVTRLTGDSWPLPGTRWSPLFLSTSRSGSAHSINDGSLSTTPPAARSAQSYPFVPSEPTETDPHTTAVFAANGLDRTPIFTDLALAEPLSLTYTTPPLQAPVDIAGPASLDVTLSSTTPITDIYAVIADVWPDGTTYPMATGQLRTSYPAVISSLSLHDAEGNIVEPYSDFSSERLSTAPVARSYQVEILPIGDHAATGHRLRLYIVGTSAYQLASPPAVNTVAVGALTSSQLLLPTVGPSAALGG
jgi:hypothetical protein